MQDSSKSHITDVLTEFYKQIGKGSNLDAFSSEHPNLQPCNLCSWLLTTEASLPHGNFLRKLKVRDDITLSLAIQMIPAERLSVEKISSPEGWISTSSARSSKESPPRCRPHSLATDQMGTADALQEVLEFPTVDRLFAFNVQKYDLSLMSFLFRSIVSN